MRTDSTRSEADWHIEHDLTEDERQILAADSERWQRLGTGAHLEEWLKFQPGLSILRQLAMRVASTNKPQGRAYKEAYSKLLRANGFDTKDSTLMHALTALVWLDAEPERMSILRKLMAAMSPGERARFNSPITARQHVQKALKTQALNGAGETVEVKEPKESATAKLKREYAEAIRERDELKRKLENDTSLCDFVRSTAAEIGKTIAQNMSETKAREVHKAALAYYATKKKSAP